jgi:hypothetical protein
MATLGIVKFLSRRHLSKEEDKSPGYPDFGAGQGAAGIRLQELCSRLAQEMAPSQNGSPLNGEQVCASREQGDAQALIKALQEQIAHLREENAWLRAKLDEALSRIPALPPAPVSRWAALKLALLGRA